MNPPAGQGVGQPPSAAPKIAPLRSGRSVERLLAAGLLAVALLMAHHPTILSGFARIQTDPGDTRLNNHMLEQTWLMLSGADRGRGLWNPAFFHPLENVGAFGDVLPAAAPPYWLWRLAGFEPDTAFQLWMLSITALNWGAFLLLARKGLGLRLVPAALGAALFAAASSRMAQMGHQQMLCHVFPALAFLTLIRLFAKEGRAPGAEPAPGGRWRTTAWLGLLFGSVAAQCWGGIYNAFFLGLLLGLAGLVGVCFRPLRRRALELLRSHWADTAVLAGLAGLAMLPLYLHYSQTAVLCGTRPWPNVECMVPRPQSWLYMGQWNWLAGGTSHWDLFAKLPCSGEHAIGLGLLTALAAMAGLYGRRGGTGVRFLAIMAALLVLLTTRWADGVTGWRLVHLAAPGGEAIRAVARVGMFLIFPAAIGLAMLLEDRGRRAVWWTAPLALLCLLEQGQTTASYDKARVRAQVADVTARVDRRATAFYVAMDPWPSGPDVRESLHLDAMWAALATGVPTVNGYSGTWPRSIHELRENPGGAGPDKLEAALSAWARENGIRREDIQFIRLPALARQPERSRILAAELPPELRSGQVAVATVTVENAGLTTWKTGPGRRIKLGGRLFPIGGESEPAIVEARAYFGGPVASGTILRMPLPIDLARVPPGRYTLKFDVVREGRYWFEQHGSQALRLEVEVLPQAAGGDG